MILLREILLKPLSNLSRIDAIDLSVPSQGTCPLRGRESSSINTISGIRPFVMGMMLLFFVLTTRRPSMVYDVSRLKRLETAPSFWRDMV